MVLIIDMIQACHIFGMTIRIFESESIRIINRIFQVPINWPKFLPQLSEQKSITRYNKLIGGLVRSSRIDLRSH